MSTTAVNIDAQGIEWDARFLGWGKGKHHIQRPGDDQTVCGREIPADEPLRGAVYSCATCARCRADEDAYEAAEAYRKACWDYLQGLREDKLSANRAGRFTVLRCKLCGAQHRTEGDGRGAVAYCMDANHPADLEEVEAVGPAWTSPSSRTRGRYE